MKRYPEIEYDFIFIDDTVVMIRFATIILDVDEGPVEYRDKFEFSIDDKNDLVGSVIKATNHFHYIAQKHIKEWK